MKESPKAARAFEDYLAMPVDGRSLRLLAETYRGSAEPVPTRQLSRLKVWSAAFDWSARIAGLAAQEREEIEQRTRNERVAVMSSGLALAHVRVELLNSIASREAALVRATSDRIEREGASAQLLERYDVLRRRLDASLKALAEETGGRIRRLNVTRSLVSYAEDLARREGFDIEHAKKLARELAEGDGTD